MVSEGALERLRERYLRLFDGEYETGIRPDEVNWVPGRDPEDRTRQLCNAWKSDYGRRGAGALGENGAACRAARRLSRRAHPPGQRALEAAGHEGDRLPPGLLVRRLPRPAGDDHLLDLAPRHRSRRGSARVRARLTHLAEVAAERTQFHAPEDWLAGAARRRTRRAPSSRPCPSSSRPGGGSFHHGLTWHGSAPNRSGNVARMALVSHLHPGRGALPRDERRRDVLPLPPPRRPRARRVVLPGALGRVRLPHALARRAAAL